MSLEILLLGSFHLTHNEMPVDSISGSARLQSLLSYLLLHRDAPQSRQQIAFQLWPVSSESQARTNLRKLFLQLRRALPGAERYLVYDNQTIGWRTDAPVSLDVAEVQHLLSILNNNPLDRDALTRLFDLYRGELLPECYDDWIVPLRTQLHQDVLAALDRLVILLENGREYDEAIRYARRLLTLDLLDERAYQRLMRLHTLNGNRAGVAAAYQECADLLQRELDVEPSPETVALYERLLAAGQDPAANVAPAVAKPHVPPLVGRQLEWQALQDAWRTAASGRPVFVTISGEAGIGKTRLAEELLTWAGQQGIRTLRARAYPSQDALAYGPIAELLRSDALRRTLPSLGPARLGQLARLMPELLDAYPDLPAPQPMTESWQRQQFFETLAQTVLGEGHPLLLLVDDIQWCDGQTMEWLYYLRRAGQQHMLLTVGTIRTGEILADHPLNVLLLTLRREDALVELPLAPLDAAQVSQLARSLGGPELADEQAKQLYADTEGNPLFVVETVRAKLDEPDAQPAQAEPMDLPAKLYAVIRARLLRLSPEAQVLLNLAAVTGRSFSYRMLVDAGGLNEDVLVDSLDELLARQVIREQDGDDFDFSHDRIRDVVYAELSRTRRRLLHRRVAESLSVIHATQLTSISGQLAHHYARAGLKDKACMHFLQAGEQALATYALSQARTYFERAQAAAQTEQEQVGVVLGLGRLHMAQDDLDAAVGSFRQGLTVVAADDARRARLLYHLADAHFARYEVAECERYVRQALEAAEALDDDETLCQSLSLLGQVQSSHGHVDAELELISEALAICRRSSNGAGNRWREARTLADLAWLRAGRGEFAQSSTHAREALALLESLDDPVGVAFAWNILGRALGGCGQYEDAFDAFAHSYECAEAVDHRFFMAQVPNMRGWLHQQLGDYVGARRHDEEGVELGRRWEKIPAEISALINLQLDILHLGAPAEALAGLQALQERIEREAFGFHVWRWQLRLAHAQGLCQLALGDAEATLALAARGMKRAKATTSKKYIALNHALTGAALIATDRAQEAVSKLKLAISLTDAIAYQPLRWQERHRLGQVYHALGRAEDGCLQHAAALDIVESIAQNLRDEQLRTTFLTSEGVITLRKAT